MYYPTTGVSHSTAGVIIGIVSGEMGGLGAMDAEGESGADGVCHQVNSAQPPAPTLSWKNENLKHAYESLGIRVSIVKFKPQKGVEFEPPQQSIPLFVQQQQQTSVIYSIQLPDGAVTFTNTGDWHDSMTTVIRNYFLHKIAQGMIPSYDPYNKIVECRMFPIFNYVRSIEGKIYRTAKSRGEYFHLLAKKLCKIQKKVKKEEMQKKREQRQHPNPASTQSSSTAHATTLAPLFPEPLTTMHLPSASADSTAHVRLALDAMRMKQDPEEDEEEWPDEYWGSRGTDHTYSQNVAYKSP